MFDKKGNSPFEWNLLCSLKFNSFHLTYLLLYSENQSAIFQSKWIFFKDITFQRVYINRFNCDCNLTLELSPTQQFKQTELTILHRIFQNCGVKLNTKTMEEVVAFCHNCRRCVVVTNHGTCPSCGALIWITWMYSNWSECDNHYFFDYC